MRKPSSKAQRILLPLLTCCSIVLLWQLSVSNGWISSLSLAAPWEAVKVAVASIDVMWPHIMATAYATVLTFALSSIGGMLLGALLMHGRIFRLAVYPSLVMFQLLPKIALAPLFVVWFGVNLISRLSFAGFISFFPIVLATLAGLRATDPLVLKLCKSVRASPAQIFWQVRLPYAVPLIMSGLKVGMTLSITGVIVSEFVTAQSGLGYIILFASSNLQIDLLFAALGWVSLIGLLSYGAVLLLERLIQWRLGAPMTGGLSLPGEAVP
ncbi:ABC transporter permease [Rhodoplanes sp. Z2-YC6860]|uniref:ABC transporter permease n=1 Tax=Rhodoplanes sp. Z2-YC6860 TaxID=674703 RepID=UPI00078BEDB5|nr:ABC transporter permease [Rhodoplanes sp. Z2-YC6860]AMN41099.1 ABC transporter permease [Rhodoplanes sp. Z2-YC6860]